MSLFRGLCLLAFGFFYLFYFFKFCSLLVKFKLFAILGEGLPLLKELCLLFLSNVPGPTSIQEYKSQLIYNTVGTVEVATAQFDSSNIEVVI